MAMIEQLAETAANAMQSIAREFQLSPEMLRGFEFVNLLADLPVIADTDQSTDDRYPVDRLTRVLDVEPAELLRWKKAAGQSVCTHQRKKTALCPYGRRRSMWIVIRGADIDRAETGIPPT
jgi:hypothetical protein